MQAVLPIVVALVAGLCVAVQAPTNAMLARNSGSLWLAASISFMGGSAAVLTIWALFDRTPIAAARQAPGWAWLGGFYGAFFVAAVSFATPRLGLAVTLTLTIAAQLTVAVVLDHFGVLGLGKSAVTFTRLIGLALIVGGVLLVRR